MDKKFKENQAIENTIPKANCNEGSMKSPSEYLTGELLHRAWQFRHLAPDGVCKSSSQVPVITGLALRQNYFQRFQS